MMTDDIKSIPDDGEKPEKLSDEQVQNLLNKGMKENADGPEADKYTQLGTILDDADFEGKSIYATVPLLGGGVFDDKGHHDAAIIREMTGRSDMLLMDLNGFDTNGLKQIVLDCVESVGSYTDKSDIQNLILGDMLIGDYLYLVMRIRQLSVGDDYRFKDQCGKCTHIDTYNVLMSELDYENPIPPLEENRHQITELSKGPMNWEIHWHFMTEGDSKYLDTVMSWMDDKEGGSKAKQKKSSDEETPKKGPSVDLLSAQMIPRIDKIVEPDGEEVFFGRSSKRTADGKLTMQQGVQYFRDLPLWIRTKFTSKVNYLEPGIDTEVVWNCANCGSQNNKIVYPMSPDFFIQLDTPID